MSPEKELVKWHSLYIRARDGYKCMLHLIAKEKNIILPMRCNGVMQCCHKISRSKKSIKYHEDNVFCGCSGSNLWANFNQIEWNEICLKLWPEEMKKLEVLKSMIYQRKRSDKINLAKYFKEKYEKIKNK